MLTDAQIDEIHGRILILKESEKRRVILDYAKRFDCKVLVETGTNEGDTVQATKGYFSEVYSIEISPSIYQRAQLRFVNDYNVHLLLGDSGALFASILPVINQKILFYLDAHFDYGGEGIPEQNPTIRELNSIFSLKPDSIILIDDARMFSGRLGGFCSPPLRELEQYVMDKNPNLVFEVIDDIIRIHA
jgi:hypothetical protein